MRTRIALLLALVLAFSLSQVGAGRTLGSFNGKLYVAAGLTSTSVCPGGGSGWIKLPHVQSPAGAWFGITGTNVAGAETLTIAVRTAFDNVGTGERFVVAFAEINSSNDPEEIQAPGAQLPLSAFICFSHTIGGSPSGLNYTIHASYNE